MAHYQHIRLKAHKGLKQANLLDLGKINVVCGPNNSGKTTVLECIADNQLHNRGITVDQSVINRLAHSGDNINWRSQDLGFMYSRIIVELFESLKLVFSDEFSKFDSEITNKWKIKLPGFSLPGSNFRYCFDSEFLSSGAVVLIPAKRRLETSKQVSAYEEAYSDGSGVLNFLFSAKNQDESSELRQKFVNISDAFQEISAGYEFDVFFQAKSKNQLPPPTVAELVFRRNGGTWIQAADCGLGLQELLIILYFALASEHEVVLVEEPENHLHPEIQRRLIAFLREKTVKQFFLSTHSSVFLNTQFADRVFTCRMTDSVHVENATSRAAALTALGYSIADNLVSDLVVLCEGPKDKLVLEEFFQKMGLLEKANIKVWPLGGDIMDQLDLSVFQESHKLIALIDNDPGSSTIRKRFQKKCEELKVPVTRLKRYAIENYFSLAAISAYMKGQMPADITELAHDKPVAEQLGFEVKKNGGKIAKEMKMEDLNGTDLEEFLNQVSKLATEERSKSVSGAN